MSSVASVLTFQVPPEAAVPFVAGDWVGSVAPVLPMVVGLVMVEVKRLVVGAGARPLMICPG